MVQIELGKVGFHMGLTGPILKEDWTLYTLKMQPAAPPAVSVHHGFKGVKAT
jgi:hypothetical protein